MKLIELTAADRAQHLCDRLAKIAVSSEGDETISEEIVNEAMALQDSKRMLEVLQDTVRRITAPRPGLSDEERSEAQESALAVTIARVVIAHRRQCREPKAACRVIPFPNGGSRHAV